MCTPTIQGASSNKCDLHHCSQALVTVERRVLVLCHKPEIGCTNNMQIKKKKLYHCKVCMYIKQHDVPSSIKKWSCSIFPELTLTNSCETGIVHHIRSTEFTLPVWQWAIVFPVHQHVNSWSMKLKNYNTFNDAKEEKSYYRTGLPFEYSSVTSLGTRKCSVNECVHVGSSTNVFYTHSCVHDVFSTLF